MSRTAVAIALALLSVLGCGCRTTGGSPAAGAHVPAASPPANVAAPSPSATAPRGRGVDPVVLVVSEAGMSTGRDALFAADASPERTVSQCVGRGHVVFRARLADRQLAIGDVLEQDRLSDAQTQCVREALASLRLRGGMIGEQVIYVRLP